MFAPDMGPGLSAILADGVDERATRLDGDGMLAPVDVERYGDFFTHAAFPAARSAARIRCGVAGISSISIPNGARASLIALSTAAGAPMAPPSPRPLAFVSEFGLGVSMW